eukprot:Nitzschia sp. Nitz4//scaffold39_size137210//95174//96831//NITZ4_003212-RA/size137210-augustus-gene-0.193-mRNA-1//-1//CDS//3329550422//7289//frame0
MPVRVLPGSIEVGYITSHKKQGETMKTLSGHSEDNPDSDIEDLVQSSSGNNELKPLNISSPDPIIPRTNSHSVSLLGLCCAHCNYACDYAPRFCWGIGFVSLLVPVWFLVMGVVFNPNEEFGVVANDYSNIQSKYDLTIGKIDHWCLKGGNDYCQCEDPLEPLGRVGYKPWNRAHVSNKQTLEALIDKGEASPDIAFLGASIVEEMDGTWFGTTRDGKLKEMQTMFLEHFSKEKGASLEAVALGIAGDTSPAVLWRLLNGEMPKEFNPKLWWLEIGLNDIARTECSEEVVVLGVLRIVEEILNQKPAAKIVINSLFPLADLRGGVHAEADDYKDSFNKKLAIERTKEIIKRNKQLQRKGLRPKGDAATSFVVDGPNRRTLVNPTEAGRRLGLFRKKKNVVIRAQKDKQRKYNAFTHKEKKLPLWTSISAINKELRKFASNHDDQVSFFDATKIFTEHLQGDAYTLNTTLISIRGHPTKEGFRLWEDAVVKYVNQHV